MEKYKAQTNVLPTMKSLGDVNKKNDVKNQAAEEMKYRRKDSKDENDVTDTKSM